MITIKINWIKLASAAIHVIIWVAFLICFKVLFDGMLQGLLMVFLDAIVFALLSVNYFYLQEKSIDEKLIEVIEEKDNEYS